jgi:hypothetical protein
VTLAVVDAHYSGKAGFLQLTDDGVLAEENNLFVPIAIFTAEGAESAEIQW